jgi:predicted nucleic acid-binding protein
MTEVFLDSSYAIALSSATDTHHQKALELAGRIQAAATLLVTTEPILFEIGNALSRSRYRQAAIHLIHAILHDRSIGVVPSNRDRFDQAMVLYTERADKSWGLTDCYSFVVMQERSITSALTADHHFQQAGYRALLLED